jgi:hypothetical protein
MYLLFIGVGAVVVVVGVVVILCTYVLLAYMISCSSNSVYILFIVVAVVVVTMRTYVLLVYSTPIPSRWTKRA